jgi:O-acetylserine/cysteine efflux transporter
MGITVALVWGMGVVFAKAALEQFPPILLMAFRFSLTALALVWFVKPPWHLMRQLFWIALISATIQYCLTFNGLRGLDASTTILVIQMEIPFLVFLGAILLGEKPGPRRWAGIGLALIGVAFIAGEPRLADAWGSIGLVVGGSACWALGQIMVRRLGQAGGLTLTAWVAVFATPQLFAFSFVFEENHLALIRGADWVVWATVVYLGLVMTALGYGLWYSLVVRHPVSRVGPFLLLMPVFSVIGGVTILDERLTLQIAIGGVFVISAVAFILTSRAPEPATEATDPASEDADPGARRFPE